MVVDKNPFIDQTVAVLFLYGNRIRAVGYSESYPSACSSRM